MNQPYVGFFEYRRERYEFDEGIAEWNGRDLMAYATSSDVTVYFCGIPFGTANSLDELNGKTYRGRGGEAAFSEGLIRFFEKNYAVTGDAEIHCVAASVEKGYVAIEFQMEIALANKRSQKVRGGMLCLLGKIPVLSEGGIDE